MSWVRFVGLRIEGQVESIPLSTALALQHIYKDENDAIHRRVPEGSTVHEIEAMTLDRIGSPPRPSYVDTRGIYFTRVEHVTIERCSVSFMPGTGLRVAEGEFVDILYNEVSHSSRRSSSGTHGLVVTKTSDRIDAPPNTYRVRIVGNHVHHNFNELYSWVGTKTFIHPAIDEGKGISLQRNEDLRRDRGRILVANNIAHHNGYSGIHSNDGDNVDFVFNTAFLNSYTNDVTYADRDDRGGNNIGISMSNCNRCSIRNNIAVVNTAWGGFAISVTTGSTVEIQQNIVFGGVGGCRTAAFRRRRDGSGREHPRS